jgi:uncharacterized protein (TIGR03086 family)
VTSIQDPDLDALTSLSAHLSAALAAIEDHQLTLATPCSDWDLAALVDHVTGGNWFTAEMFGGQTADKAMTNTLEQFGGGTASIAEATSSVNEQAAAFSEPGVLDQTWRHVAGDLTGRQILRLRIHDLIVHTWDIKQTLDPPSALPTGIEVRGAAAVALAGILRAYIESAACCWARQL